MPNRLRCVCWAFLAEGHLETCDKRQLEDEPNMQSNMMCPHCGELFDLKEPDYLIPYHDHLKPLRVLCPGSKQNPRCAESDRRLLWNGKPNPHAQ